MPHAFPLVLLLQAGAAAPVVINEFAYDDSGVDDREYIELYNRTALPVDISGWVVDCGDPTVCAGVCGGAPACLAANNNADFAIPGAPGSATTVLAAGDYYVIGTAIVPGVDQVFAPGAAGIIENSEEWISLVDPLGAIVDTVSYETNLNEACFPLATRAEGPGIHGNQTMTDLLAPAFARLSWSRVSDGFDTDNNGRDFAQMPASPGASNDLASILLYAADFDAAVVGVEPAEWGGSFVNPHVIDPTLVDANNPNAIAASPQGGNALIFWDPTGGGNAGLLVSQSTDRVDLECYVYLDAAAHAASAIAQFESWTIGAQGTSDSFGNHPDPGGLLAANGITGLASPNTGIGWTYVHHTTIPGVTTGVLYLVDYNDGGTDNILLGSIPITAGGNDGWQRLRLRVNGSRVDGWFGGPLGTTEGVHIAGTASQPGPGTTYFQYRELVSVNATTRPLTVDAVRVEAAEAGVDFVTPPSHCFGSGGCAPSIGWSGGAASVTAPGPFSVDLARANSPSTAVLLIGVVNTGLFPLDLGLLFPPASGPCYLLQDFPILVTLASAGGGPCAGTSTVGFGSLAGATVGGTIYVQYGVIDPVTPLGFPIVMSDGLAVTLQP
ncbi:MAG: lamin tail domain-containing protein [Planctomycetes bacterium]|nr:lamin tail domain-containing protein [Planctomycetota bacterium]